MNVALVLIFRAGSVWHSAGVDFIIVLASGGIFSAHEVSAHDASAGAPNNFSRPSRGYLLWIVSILQRLACERLLVIQHLRHGIRNRDAGARADADSRLVSQSVVEVGSTRHTVLLSRFDRIEPMWPRHISSSPDGL